MYAARRDRSVEQLRRRHRQDRIRSPVVFDGAVGRHESRSDRRCRNWSTRFTSKAAAATPAPPPTMRSRPLRWGRLPTAAPASSSQARRHRDRRPGDQRGGTSESASSAPAKASPSATPGSGSSSTAAPARRSTGIEIGPDSVASGDRRADAGSPATCSRNSGEGLKVLGADLTPDRRQLLRRRPGRDHGGGQRRGHLGSRTQAAGSPPEGTQIGTELSPSEATSPACDGPCNVIASGATTGIDLRGATRIGESLTSGRRRSGIHIGLDAPPPSQFAGQAVAASTRRGRRSTDDRWPRSLTARRPTTSRRLRRDRCSSGPALLPADRRQHDRARAAPAPALSPPSNQAIAIDSSGITNATARAIIERNRLAMGGGEGIAPGGPRRADQRQHDLRRPHGIRTVDFAGVTPRNTIEGNVIEVSGEAAIELQSPRQPGLRQRNRRAPAPPGSRSTRPDRSTSAATRSAATRRRGKRDLRRPRQGDRDRRPRSQREPSGAQPRQRQRRRIHRPHSGRPGEAGPNGAIKPPAITERLQSPRAARPSPGHVRVFRKATDEPGELASFLGRRDRRRHRQLGGRLRRASGRHLGRGHPDQPRRRHLRTECDGETPPDPPANDGADRLEILCAVSTRPAGARRRPATRGSPRRPQAESKSTTAKFKFTSDVSGSSFECKLDKGKFAKCSSPKTYKKLKPGKHVFKSAPSHRAGPRTRRRPRKSSKSRSRTCPDSP